MTRDSVCRAISTRMTDPSGIAIGPSGNRSPDAISTTAGVTIAIVSLSVGRQAAALTCRSPPPVRPASRELEGREAEAEPDWPRGARSALQHTRLLTALPQVATHLKIRAP